MTLLIWGAGAIGGTIGAYLARAGVDVVLVDTDVAHVEAMQTGGLHIEGPIETFTVRVRAATPDQVEGQFDRILLCVKAHHTQAATRALHRHVAPGGYVASFQNGLCELVIGDIIGPANVVGAFINFGADYLAPGRILYGGRGACVIGEVDGPVTPRVTALRDVMTVYEPDAIATDDIMGFLWGKLGYGALLFATAVTNESIADVLNDPAHRPVLIAIAREAIAVAMARGVTPRGLAQGQAARGGTERRKQAARDSDRALVDEQRPGVVDREHGARPDRDRARLAASNAASPLTRSASCAAAISL